MRKLEPDIIKKYKLWKPGIDDTFKWSKETNSWFNIFQLKKSVKKESTKFCSTKCIRAHKIFLSPNTKQREILFHWFEIYRLVYNNTINYLKTNNCFDFKKLRRIIDNHIKENSTLANYCKKYKMPKHTRDNAIKDVIKAYKTAFTNLKNKTINFFRMKTKRKSCNLKSIVIESGSFSKRKNGFCVSVLGEIKSNISLSMAKKDSRLCYDNRTGCFMLLVPYEKPTKTFLRKNEICSLDPGIRTFQTVYTPAGNCYEICSSATSHKIDSLIKNIESPKGEQKKYKNYVKRLREKVRNCINDLHWKTCNFLCKNFKRIVIGNMSTRSIVQKSELPKSVKRKAYYLSNYTFKQRLKSKCEEHGCVYKEIDESYTSKTCSVCGCINDNLGKINTFNCMDCSFSCDRDVNGARNILYKYIELFI